MREIKFKIYDKNDTNCIIGPFDWNKLPQFLFPENFTLLQYTGLKDKNGVEIYEGDILIFKPSYNESLGGQFQNAIFSVVFDDGSFKFKDEFADQESSSYYEIIGNIYKNPELLK